MCRGGVCAPRQLAVSAQLGDEAASQLCPGRAGTDHTPAWRGMAALDKVGQQGWEGQAALWWDWLLH